MTEIYFRADANSTIATGHIMRCLTIARACTQTGRLQDKFVQVSFIVSDDESRSLLEARFEKPGEFSVFSLNSDYRRMEAEIPDLLSHITGRKADGQKHSPYLTCAKPWLFVDSYHASPSYFHALSAYCKIAYLDDLRSFDCPVDLLINYDTDSDSPCYAASGQKLLGAQYTPLRAQFQAPSYNVRPKAEHVLLSTGGTDSYGMAEYLLYWIYDAPNCSGNRPALSDSLFTTQLDTDKLQALQYHIVTSKANTRYDRLLALEEKISHIHIYENVSDMASLMASCDMAVSAGGTTLAELCAVGVPTISYLMAENQRTAVETYAAKELIPCAGDIRPGQIINQQNAASANTMTDCFRNPLPDSVICNILHFLTYMSENAEIRQKSSHNMRAFLDGCGAERIAKALLSP